MVKVEDSWTQSSPVPVSCQLSRQGHSPSATRDTRGVHGPLWGPKAQGEAWVACSVFQWEPRPGSIAHEEGTCLSSSPMLPELQSPDLKSPTGAGPQSQAQDLSPVQKAGPGTCERRCQGALPSHSLQGIALTPGSPGGLSEGYSHKCVVTSPATGYLLVPDPPARRRWVSEA